LLLLLFLCIVVIYVALLFVVVIVSLYCCYLCCFTLLVFAGTTDSVYSDEGKSPATGRGPVVPVSLLPSPREGTPAQSKQTFVVNVWNFELD
jgi:hypothetical protein